MSMKNAAITNQLKRIDALRVTVQRAKKDLKKLKRYTSNLVFRDALEGEHDYFRPSGGREEYMRRWDHYRPDVESRVSSLIEEASSLPMARSQKWDKKRDVRVGIVADPFLFESLEPAANFIPVTPSNYEEVIGRIDLLLVVSTWRGLDGEWHGASQKASSRRKLLELTIMPLAQAEGVPVAFYSKEDPPNYDVFLSTARRADVVFTSSIEKVEQYKRDLGDSVPVFPIRFGVNFQKHNPLGCMRHEGRELVFAGSWMAHKYKTRARDAKRIFDGVNGSSSSLTIVDRNLDLDPEKFSDPDRYLYPEEFLPNLHGPLSHDDVLRIQKLLPLAVNLNSVVGSQTMFANRVVELLAMGTLVLSNYSAGVNSLYPSVALLHSELDTKNFIDTLTPSYIRYCQVEGIREVFNNDTAFDRIDQILDAVGVECARQQHRILVVAGSHSEFKAFADSQETKYPLTFVPVNDWESLVGSEDGDIVIRLDRLTTNSPDFVSDVVAAYRYSDADSLKVIPFDSSDPAYEVEKADGVAEECQVFWLEPGERAAGKRVSSVLTIMTSSSSYHAPRENRSYELTVIVPTYNNGKHLVHKCFNSLYRGSSFDRSRILIVDDGSTDKKTQACVNMLEQRYSNVDVFRFPEGGSGSASRPRNKGLELTETPFVTYLDPDNEQVRDSYAVLLDACKEQEVDFAIGNMLRFKGNVVTVNNAKVLRAAKAKSAPMDGCNRDLVAKMNFQPMSIQALVARTDWLKSLGLEQPVGAVGQDSYFFQQMIFYARSITITTRPIHAYYAAVTNSTVNSVSPRFYRKYIPLEEVRSEWLKSVGLFEEYGRTRFKRFLEGWYLGKLKHVAPEDRSECLSILREITSLYGESVVNDPEVIALFEEADAVA